jgi:uncharacterized Zn finger protein (UPF0148 family)
MRAIARATEDLARRVASHCPRCERPGFGAVERIAGLACADCGAPTRRAKAERWMCPACQYAEERAVAGPAQADPFGCDACNP